MPTFQFSQVLAHPIGMAYVRYHEVAAKEACKGSICILASILGGRELPGHKNGISARQSKRMTYAFSNWNMMAVKRSGSR